MHFHFDMDKAYVIPLSSAQMRERFGNTWDGVRNRLPETPRRTARLALQTQTTKTEMEATIRRIEDTKAYQRDRSYFKVRSMNIVQGMPVMDIKFV